jgi:dienelactone hydrolase
LPRRRFGRRCVTRRPPRGRFPLVVIAHSNPAAESTTAEYLASHGFVVAAVPSKGTSELAYHHELPDVETLIRDLQFVIAMAKTLPFVDGGKVGVIGMSAGSVAAVALQFRDPSVRAVVSLDGGIGENRGSLLVTQTQGYDPPRLRAPLLHLYTRDNPHLDTSRLKSWQNSERVLVEFPRMRHGDFLAYAMADHEWAPRYVLQFLGHFLQGRRGIVPDVPPGLVTVEWLPEWRGRSAVPP